MELEVFGIAERATLSQCAELMATSSPWNRLHFTKAQCEESLTSEDVSVFGTFDPAGEVLGFLAAMEHGIGSEPMIEYLCVRPEARSRGVGTRLVDYFESVLYPSSDNYYLFVSDINPEAAKLYRKLGYVMVGALPDFNLVSQTEFLYRKSVRPRQGKNEID